MRDYSVTCKQCSIVFQRSRTNPKQQFCSRDCVNAFRSNRPKKPVKLHTLICLGCGKPFTNKHVRQRYCSHACDGTRYKVNKSRVCEQCGIPFERSDTNTKQRMCSLKCVFAYNQARAKGQATVVCEECGDPFTLKYKGKRYCSRACFGSSLRTKMLLTDNRYGIQAKKAPTKPELKMREALTNLGLFFFAEYPFYWYVIDFFLPFQNIALEVDGVYWHSSPRYIAHDKRRDTYMIAKGIEVVRITDTEINETDNLSELVKKRLILKIT